VLREFRARLARADARLRAGKTAPAALDLDSAIALVDAVRAAAKSAPLRTSLADAARDAFDRMVMVQVNAGESVRALAYLERAREAFAPLGPGAGAAAMLPRPRRGETALEYALIGDTLLAWTVDRAGIRLTRTSISRARLLRTTRRVLTALEQQADERAVAGDLALLYDWLIRPMRGGLGPDSAELVVVADGEIAAVPFAALRDGARGQYLVQDRPLRFAATLRDAFTPPRRHDAAKGRMLVVEAGTEAARAAGRSPLPAARAEAASVAGAYPGARIISGVAATPGAVGTALGQAEVVHYAGHAVFDDERPEQSFLALTPPRRNSSGRLTARDIQALDLRAVRLVVLSACETERAQDRRSGGFSGLSAALLRAGAGGVVGTLWEVNDEMSGPLVAEFHRAYRATGDPAQALRTAQLRLLASRDAALRSPAAWAGFRYAGS
jgi:CHAT domain-containing protein